MTATVFLVFFTILFCVFNAYKIRKKIERSMDKDFLKNARQDVSIFDDWDEADKQKTFEKLKKLKKLKGKYND